MLALEMAADSSSNSNILRFFHSHNRNNDDCGVWNNLPQQQRPRSQQTCCPYSPPMCCPVNKQLLPFFLAVLFTHIVKIGQNPINGILMDGLDWWFSMMMTLWIANGACVTVLQGYGRNPPAIGCLPSCKKSAAFFGSNRAVNPNVIEYNFALAQINKYISGLWLG